MLSYCLKCGKNTKSKMPKVIVKIKNGRLMLLRKSEVCDIKNLGLQKNKKLVDY